MSDPSANTPHVLFTVEDGVAVVTLNRPDNANAFSGRMGTELGEAFTTCDRDDEIRQLNVKIGQCNQLYHKYQDLKVKYANLVQALQATT